MIKQLLILCMALIGFTALQAQPVNLKPLVSGPSHAAGLDTITNAGNVTQVIKIQGYQNIVTIQTAVTKLTGTPTLGSVKVFGSVDSLKWDNIPVGITSAGVPVTTVLDTLAVTNIAGAQVHTWCITPSRFQYYKVIAHGGNGSTQTSTVTTQALWRKE